jgi:hypothetical protein
MICAIKIFHFIFSDIIPYWRMSLVMSHVGHLYRNRNEYRLICLVCETRSSGKN